MSASSRILSASTGVLAGPLLVTAGLLVLGATSNSPYEFGTASVLAIDLIALIGLNIMAGHAGQLSLGHAGLVGAGAYSVVIAAAKFGLSGGITLVIAPLVGALLAVVIGIPALRLRGLYFAVATLAFAVIIDYFDINAVSLTGGPDGVSVNPLQLGSRSYSSPGQYFYLVVAIAAVVMVLERLFTRTWVAWGLKAARASEPAASSAGVPIFGARLGAFTLSGAIAGLAGALLAYETLYLSPSSFSLSASINFFVVLFIGGLATFLGPVFGAFILFAFAKWLAPYPNVQPYLLGAFFLLSLRFFPRGFGGSINFLWARLQHRRKRLARPGHDATPLAEATGEFNAVMLAETEVGS